MMSRSSLAPRGHAIVNVLLPVAAVFAMASTTVVACSNSTIAALADDAGDANVDGTVDGDTDGGGGEGGNCAVDAGPVDMMQAALGKQLVMTHKCQTCHGSALSGNNDGVVSQTAIGGTAYPPNLTSDPATGLGCWTNAQIENAILNGIDNQGMALCSPMPVFGHIAGDAGLTADEAAQVVQYLRSLPTAKNQVMNTPDCPVPEGGAPEAGPSDGGLPPPPVRDGGRDASRPDSGMHLDSGPPVVDSGVDTGTPPADAGLDAPAETGPDAPAEASGDDGGPDATIEAGTNDDAAADSAVADDSGDDATD